MPAVQSVMVKLSAPRGEQLRAYAAREGLSVTNAIGALLKLANAADTVPGFEIERAHPDVPAYRFTFDGFSVTGDVSLFLDLADYIEKIIDLPGAVGKGHVFSETWRELLIARGTGTSILFRGLDHHTDETVVRVLPYDLARDLASMIRRVVA